MATYEFEDSEGRYVTVEMPIGTAPKIGTTAKVGGRLLTRIPSRPLAAVAENIGFSSLSLPLNWKYAPRHNAQGEAEFHSMREVRESVARANAHGENIAWNP